MTPKVSFFRVGNGDMTLITLASGRTILIDCNIRAAADDAGDATPDVCSQLKDRLRRDGAGRPYVDAMILSHPDADHCRGVETHFHLAPLADYVADGGKIVIREMWSSPMVFRRACRSHVLCPDAKAWNKEAKRRVAVFRSKGSCDVSERVQIIGEDEDGKTDDLAAILVRIDEVVWAIDGSSEPNFEARLLAPLPKSDSEDEEEALSKNDSSIIFQFKIADAGVDPVLFLSGGDAEVGIWERLWARKSSTPDHLAYDLLQAPHHCSWHSLSWESWSQKGEDAKVSPDARDALGQARSGAVIVASSKPIKDDDSDPPCIRAKREYRDILAGVKGDFVCVGDGGPEPLEYQIGYGGLSLIKAATPRGPTLIGVTPQGHG
ncbi:MAG: MBL fold metallo-hydrolase [Alphaproteobacteria bacterium]|uniref:Metallo-beta-lactamase domain-containing protein n=1 Tax=Brevundimonas mediterranea TaxID=74329 RepID=A0A7Z8Y390_9CAUL|nr:MBL fold metallo-hydrolase [Brevundimonas mediterranea]MBU2031160.1 MBL fold metallo-hydrolase [Alphaproteobacteria bacterium]TAJ40632.1 MAG: MBL fold metallo-hydrolase [Brevundimonas sp.]MBU2163935.1 MBL fold metallo-hydrolase [Alphaproteobacteria bacterium]MBU2230367.1 MBL fold metallo-hydrolase [Alphaproteobacteria bacterium]VDC50094.1 hypothetical protein BREV_BREV_00170 [Brevundimonas mediterranea]